MPINLPFKSHKEDIINIESLEIATSQSTQSQQKRNHVSDDEFDQNNAVDFRVSDLSQPKPEIISLDDTLEDSDFSFTVHEPVTKKPKTTESDFLSYQEKMKQINKTYGAALLKEVNKVSKKKEELLAEMIMSIPKFVHDRFHQEGLLQEDDFPHTKVEVNHNDRPVINWRRKVKAKYDASNDLFLPCSPQEIHESCRVLYYQAEEFFSKLTLVDLDNETEVQKSIPFQANTILMIEGYSQQLTKINNLENKIYKQRVLQKDQTTKELKYTTKDLEHLINKLQFKYLINVYPVKNLTDARDWLISFTYTMAFGMYDKFERNPEFSNLIGSKSGTDYKTTFLETIHKFKLMPYARCERLFLYYDNLEKISTRYKTNNTLGKDKDGKTLVPESTELGMHNLFNSTDPNEIIYS